jgi:hypothetical protein
MSSSAEFILANPERKTGMQQEADQSKT